MSGDLLLVIGEVSALAYQQLLTLKEREREREVRRGWAFVQIMEGSCRYSALANKSWRSGLCSQ